MKAKDTSLLTFMRNATQRIIPIYQRTYSWKREQCEQLWAGNSCIARIRLAAT
jgi:uncharacterized protein with ParB-like and HNH nuclease domain